MPSYLSSLFLVLAFASTKFTACYLSTRAPVCRSFSHLSAKSNWLRKLEEEKARRGLADLGSGGPTPPTMGGGVGNSSGVTGKYERAEEWDARGAGDVDLAWEERVKFDSRAGGDPNKQQDVLDRAIRE